MDWTGVALIYGGMGLALGWLRLVQGKGVADALFATLAWPLEWAAGWLALVHEVARAWEDDLPQGEQRFNCGA